MPCDLNHEAKPWAVQETRGRMSQRVGARAPPDGRLRDFRVLACATVPAYRKRSCGLLAVGLIRVNPTSAAIDSPPATRIARGGEGSGVGRRGVHRNSGSCRQTPNPRPLPTASRGRGEASEARMSQTGRRESAAR
jgi:hypothetical protein